MKRTIAWLALFFAIQLFFALILFSTSSSKKGDFKTAPLFLFDKNSLSKVAITDESNMTMLQKVGAKWLLPGRDLPVELSQLDSLLDAISGLQTNWPVSTTSSSHRRFEVSDESFQKKIELFSSENSLGILYIGTSPRFKTSHFRLQGRDDVYALEFDSYDVSAKETHWLEKSLLIVDGIDRVRGQDYELVGADNVWTLATKLDGEKIDQGKIDNFIKSLQTFKVVDIVQNAPEYLVDESIRIEVHGDQKIYYHLLEMEETYYVKRSDIETVFTLSRYSFNNLAKPSRSAFSFND